MKELIIKRKNGDTHVFIVDDADFQRVVSNGPWRYHGKGYAHSRKAGLLHRFILNLRPGQVGVDHVDRNKKNNQRSNLVQKSNALNNKNKSRTSAFSSKFTGIHYDQRRRKWIAQLCWSNKKKTIGRFDTDIEAARAYCKAVQLKWNQNSVEALSRIEHNLKLLAEV